MNMNTNQLPPELIKYLIETGELDPEQQALMQQMETADALRGVALGNRSRDAFGAIAQGLAGYGSGKMGKEFAGKLKPFNERRIGSRKELFGALFPSGGQAQGAERSALAMQQMPTLGRMSMPDEEDPYMP